MDGGNYFSYIIDSENDDSHLCETAMEYKFIMTGGAGNAASITQAGVFDPVDLRKACWHKTNAVTEDKAYSEETSKLEGKSFDGSVLQKDDNHLVVDFPSSPLCQGQKTHFELQRQ